MKVLENKRILIISTDKWRKLHVSKHHYAIELEKCGNEIFFLNPVEPGTPKFRISTVENHKKIHAVDFDTTIRGRRFIPKGLIRIIEFFQIRLLLFLIKEKIDIVWCFSDFSFKSLDLFNAKIVIFHPVDMMLSGGNEQANRADYIFSVAENILACYKRFNEKTKLINHGMSDPCKLLAIETLRNLDFHHDINKKIRFGYVGNLLRFDIDHPVFLRLVSIFPNVEFHFWGPYEYKAIDLEYGMKESVEKFIKELRSFSNVKMYGLVDSKKLAEDIQNMDGFLICYDAKKEINKCSNNHKVIEYLSTGKCVVSNYISSYDDKRDLVVMPTSHENTKLPELFGMVIDDLDKYNSKYFMEKRIRFALENTYEKHLSQIDDILNGSNKKVSSLC